MSSPLYKCARCELMLPAGSFRPDPQMRRGLHSWCNECQRDASRRWRAAHPEALSGSRRVAQSELACSECGKGFKGRDGRLTCSRKCRDKRYQRLHPVEYAAKRKRKDARRRARARGDT